MKVTPLGRPATFYIPSSKWDSNLYTFRNKTIKVLVHEFLVGNYNGYTIQGSVIGHWRPSRKGSVVVEDVMEVRASFLGKERIPKLQKFLAGICRIMQEECIYLETGEDSWLVYL